MTLGQLILIDIISKNYFDVDFDKNGRLAQRGKINNRALLSMLNDNYFHQKPPKSTGFEKFNGTWLDKFIKKYNLDKNPHSDCHLSDVYKCFGCTNNNNLDSTYLFFSGGGSKNSGKKRCFKKNRDVEIKKLSWGLDYKNLESSAFAWLAMQINED